VCGNCQSELTRAAAPRRQASSNDTNRLRRPKSDKSKRKRRDREGVRRADAWAGEVAGKAPQRDPRHEPEPEPHLQPEQELDLQPEEELISTSLPSAQPERGGGDLMQLEYRGPPKNPGRGGTEDIAVLDDGSVRRVQDIPRRSKSGTKPTNP
jgi:hypothetical protein